MSLIESLDNLSNKLNNVADNVCNSNTSTENTNQNGLSGLGALNEFNKNTVIETPGGFLQKNDTDNRKLVTDKKRFNTPDNFQEYLINYFNNTGILKCSSAEQSLKESLNFSEIFYTQFTNSSVNTSCENVFCIFPILSVHNVQTLIEQLAVSTITTNNNKCVAIGYFNYDIELKNQAKNIRLELIGIEDIFDINNAVDSADKSEPYLALDKDSFRYRLASELNKKYKNNTNENMIDTITSKINNFANTIENKLNNRK